MTTTKIQNWEVQLRTGECTWSIMKIDAASPDGAVEIALRCCPNGVLVSVT